VGKVKEIGIGNGHGNGKASPVLRRSSHTFILYLSESTDDDTPVSNSSYSSSISVEDVNCASRVHSAGTFSGGETCLLKKIPANNNNNNTRTTAAAAAEEEEMVISLNVATNVPTSTITDQSDTDSNIIYSVKPRRGRLLFFPHMAPHEGRPVFVRPGGEKLILRGELYC
jgi:hypothetical protein